MYALNYKFIKKKTLYCVSNRTVGYEFTLSKILGIFFSYLNCVHFYNLAYIDHTSIYYTDSSVLLVDFIWNYIRDPSGIFCISSLVKISLTLFLCFSFVLRLFFYFRNTHIYVIKRKLHVSLNIWSLSFRGKKILWVSAVNEWNFIPVEDKRHMFAPPCNILHILHLKSH